MSTNRVVVFGTRDLASLAHFYLSRHTPFTIVAFTVDGPYLPPEGTFEGKPVLPFETIEQEYVCSKFKFFAPIADNGDRARIYNAAKVKGYELISYVSPRATVLNSHIGDNCFILEDNTIQPFVVIGNNVVMWSGNHIGHHSIIHDHVFFTSHVVLSGHCTVGEHCFFGVNSTIRDGLTIAEGTTVAMGACVVKDTEPWGTYIGVPAKRKIEG